MKEELKKYKGLVDEELEKLAGSVSGNESGFFFFFYDMLSEYILRGGKRLRAISCIKAYEAFSGKKEKRILLPAISLELYHAASLVHDDIMDEDEIRRNKASMHKLYQDMFLKKFSEKKYNGSVFSRESVRFGVSSGIIQGNMMFSLVLDCLVKSSFSSGLRSEAVMLIQDSYRKVNEGQLLDVYNEFSSEVGEKDYLEMAALKTGNLFATSLELGGVLAGIGVNERKLLHDFGVNIAIAFQIQDDLMDIDSDSKKGNTFGSDIMKGKMTLLMINALGNCSDLERKEILKVFGKNTATKSEILKVVDVFEKTGSIDRAKELAEIHVEQGKECLKGLEKRMSAEGYSFFSKLAEYMTERKV